MMIIENKWWATKDLLHTFKHMKLVVAKIMEECTSVAYYMAKPRVERSYLQNQGEGRYPWSPPCLSCA